MKIIHICLLIAAGLLALSSQARTLRVEEVPEPLKPWVDWVLLDNSEYPCPFLYNSFELKRCAWPSRLTLNLNEESGEFSFDWKVFAESWVPLPGDLKQWPLDVRINEQPQPVMQREGLPHVRLKPGNFTLRGRFLWDFMPDNLKIPEDSALIGLQVKGKAIDFPIIKQGQLWLKGGDSKQSIEDKLDLQVFRHIDDDVPLKMLTRLELQVAGKQRELKLSSPMLENFVPMRLQSPLPARIDPEGGLLLQLRPGRWQIDLQSRHVGPVEQLDLLQRFQPWPQQEIWVFAAHPELRLVEIENIHAIDAQLTNLPDEWKNLPAYRVESGDTLHFKLIRRGDPKPQPDHLNIERSLWLDFDGQGYSVNDRISGTMTQSWRLNALPESRLGKVSLNGNNQLITHLADSNENGVEVRKGQLDLSADLRLSEPIDKINAVGWKQSFHHAQAVLNLPPGWRLLAADGVDNVPDSWISRWTMLDFFLVLIGAFAIGRMWNIYWGAFALLTFALIWHEPDAPRWIWLNSLAVLALLRVFPFGRMVRFVKFYRNVVWLVLLVILIPFAVGQVRVGLYPQLEKSRQTIGPSGSGDLAEALSVPAGPPSTRSFQQRAMLGSVEATLKSDQEMDWLSNRSVELQRIDPDANVQTGPGLPQWQWNSIELSWNGPVDSAQQIRFWYLSPGFTRLFNFLSALLVVTLALLNFGVLKARIRLRGYLPWLFLAPLLYMPGGHAEAAFPDPDLLDELKSRLLQAPDCLPSCAEIPQMDLTIDSNTMTLTLQADIQDKIAFPLPGQAQQWLPQSVSLDEKPIDALYRSPDGVLWVNLDPGQHRLLLQGLTPRMSKFSLPLPLNPHRVDVQAETWLVEGLHENRSPDAQLQFTRQRSDQGSNNPFAIESDLLPPFVRVERTLHLGLDWHVDTRLLRITPAGAAVVIDVPLLDGESVTTAGIRVKEGKVLVNMPADQQELQWQSVLEQKSPITLKAAQTAQWSEVWSAEFSPIWHMQSQGITVVHHQDPQGQWLPEWRPWPGETVTLSIERPKAVPGQTLTIDKSHLEVRPGERMRETVLNFTLRSSQGTQHIITLPKHAVLQSVMIDQLSQPVRQEGRQLTLPIRPGSQEIRIDWREPIGVSTVWNSPKVNLGIESVNSSLQVGLGQDRWTLLTFGPALGPAVLFWGLLFVIAVLSLGLGKISLTPLRVGQWFLLLIGLSQIRVESALLVVGWLMLSGYRAIHPPERRLYFNAAQIGIVLLTLLSLILLAQAIEQGLLGSPEMQIEGNQSSAYELNWYQDRSPAQLPQARVISVPLKVYRSLMLGWSLWLAMALVKTWLKWAWTCFSAGGIWKKAGAKEDRSQDASVEDQRGGLAPDKKHRAG